MREPNQLRKVDMVLNMKTDKQIGKGYKEIFGTK